MPQEAISRTHELEEAFRAFNQQSLQLEASYRELEHRVAVLTRELAAARSERFKQLVEKERLAGRLERLLDALPGAVIVVDGEGVVREANPGAVELFGEPLLGIAWSDITHRVFTPHQNAGGELSLCDGRRISVSKRALVVEPGHILLFTDVTETRRLQELLERNNRLSTMGEMTASLAHQIRTPLAAAMLYASQLAQHGAPEPAQHRSAGKVLARLRHLERMVNDMLVFARGGRAGQDRIEVEALLDGVAAALETHLHGTFTLELAAASEPISFFGNYEALLGALVNLAMNALQATDGSARLRLRAGINSRRELELSVQDDGPGISADVQERLFEPFFTTRPDGTGLGLAVVRSVAHAHGGEVWVQSEPGNGSTFGIRLPIRDKEDALPSAGASPACGKDAL